MKFVVPLLAYLATCCYAAPFVLPRAFTANLPQLDNTTANNTTALKALAPVWSTAGQPPSFLNSLASFLPFQQRQSFPSWPGINQFPNAAQISEATSISMPSLPTEKQNNSQPEPETELNLPNPTELRSMPEQSVSLPQFNSAPAQFGFPQFASYSPQIMPNNAYSIPEPVQNPYSYPILNTYPYQPFSNFKPQELPRSSLAQMEFPLGPSLSSSQPFSFPGIRNAEQQFPAANWPSQGFPFQPVMPQNQFWASRGQATFPNLNMNLQPNSQPMPQFANVQSFPFASSQPVPFPQAVNFKPNPFQSNLFTSSAVTAKPSAVQSTPSFPGFLSALFGQQADMKQQ